MAEPQKLDIRWVRWPDYRIFHPTGVQTAVTDVGQGKQIIARFLSTWTMVKKETVQVEEYHSAEINGLRQVGPSVATQENVRIEHFALELTPRAAGDITRMFLTMFAHFPDDIQQQIRQDFANLSK